MATLETINTTLFNDLKLISYWRFENNLNDSGTAGNNLTAVNTPTYTSGQFGSAISLGSASTQYAKITDNASLSDTGDISVSGWINLSSLAGDDMAIVSKYDYANNDREYTFFVEGATNKLKFHYSAAGSGGSETQLRASTVLGTGSWYYVVASIDVGGKTGTFYINGTADTTTAASSNAGTIRDGGSYFGLGAFVANTGTFLSGAFNGKIDDLCVFKKQLSPTEVSNHWNGLDGLSTGINSYKALLGVGI